VPGIFHFCYGRADKEWKRAVLTIKANIDICNRLEHGGNCDKLVEEYGIGSLIFYDM
jgi:hypothetical protein